jgi:ABC-type branched-subunit amino acid transport system permease subunit
MEYIIYFATLIAIYATLTMSLNLLVGYTGLLSIAQAALYGVGAYVAALVALLVTSDLFVAFAAAAIIGIVVSLIVALPALRLSDEYFLIATLGFQSIIYNLFMNLDITRGPEGLYGIPKPTVLGFELRSSLSILCVAVVVAIVCYWLSSRLAASPFGRTLRAVRENQVAVSALGKSVFRFKTAIFLYSAVFTSAAGVVYTFAMTAIDPFAFRLDESIFIITLVLVGGTGNLKGSILAAVLLVLLPESFKYLAIPDSVAAPTKQILFGLILVLFTRFRRQGLIGEYKDVLK